METTAQNTQIAEKIIRIFADEHCTVQQAQDILGFVSGRVRIYSEVKYSAENEILSKGLDR